MLPIKQTFSKASLKAGDQVLDYSSCDVSVLPGPKLRPFLLPYLQSTPYVLRDVTFATHTKEGLVARLVAEHPLPLGPPIQA